MTLPMLSPVSIALAATGILLAAGSARAQDPEPITIGERHTVRSELLDEDRRIVVFTPSSYDGEADTTFTVMYLLDGPQHFHHTTGIVDFLEKNGRIPPMIVVGIGNTDRMRDLTPSKPDGDEPMLATTGGSDRFLQFLTDELTPWIDERYRTRPVRILVGHSLGGLFGVYALQARPNFFRGIIAISPSMQWDEQKLVGETRTWLESRPEVEGAIYLTAGNEGIGLLGGTHQVAGLLSEHAPGSLRWEFRHMPTETHGSVPHRSTYDGLEFVFDGWSLQDPLALYETGGWPAIEAHYARVRSRFGYDAEPPREAAAGVASGLVATNRFADAIAFGTARGEEVPAGFWNFLAGQCSEKGDEANAIKAHQACLAAHPHDEQARKALIAAGIEPPPIPDAVAVDASLLERYAGKYRIIAYDGLFELEVVDGTLWFQRAGRDSKPLRALSPREFLADYGTFVFDDAEPPSLKFETNGRALTCQRLSDGADG